MYLPVFSTTLETLLWEKPCWALQVCWALVVKPVTECPGTCVL